MPGHVKTANNAFGNLAAAIGTGDLTITLQAGQGQRFPATLNGDWFYATILNASGALEVIKCISRNGDILTTVIRGWDNTTPLAFVAGSPVEARLEQSIFNSDIYNAFMARDGQYPATANLDMGGFQITDSKDPVNPTDLVTKQYVDALVAKAMPLGAIMMWKSATIPAGWQIADGTNGTADLRNSFIVGAGSGYAVLATGGANTVVLDLTMIPSHAHSGSTDAQGQHNHSTNENPHAHSFLNTRLAQDSPGSSSYQNGPQGNSFRGEATQGYNTNTAVTGITLNPAGNHAHNVSTVAQGGGQPHENRPPYTALFYIQKMF
jgi:microcystin-dependent protein